MNLWNKKMLNRLNHSRPISENNITKKTIKNYILKKFSTSDLIELLEDIINEINQRKQLRKEQHHG